MSNLVYPDQVRGLTYNVVKTPEFFTLVQDAPNQYTTRIVQSQNPIWHWELIYNYLYDMDNNLLAGESYSDLKILMGFYLARQGQFDDFLFWDPKDNFVGPALNPDSTPNPQAQLQVVTDGVNFYSPIQRNFGGQFYEDITDLGPGGLTLYANGALQTPVTDYIITGPGLAVPGASFMGLYVQWVTSPGTPVTAEFNFYFRVRFESDKVEFEEFMNDLWTLGGADASGGSALQIMSARRPPQ